MDNPDLREMHSWAPDPPLVGLAWVLAALGAGAVFLIGDAPGRLLLGVLAVAAGLAGLFGTVARPRLAADPQGVTVRGLTGRRHWAWTEVTVRLTHTRRLGREIATIELDADPDLVVLGRLDLGADPVEVIETLRALRA
ncbi:PH domain-containing protein [Actinophytocola sp.]|uniref:PH domain-containing protein n=1 Tax=Actinophytocola sp. TaxID=1872138 RepID=UPI002D7E2B04|nr:PH domain-containing protein [Actinophytocola sp.]HET9142313.1 PH domain-containing protein [Actinophytocola sp.]